MAARYTLTPRVDLAVFHAADAARYRGTGGEHMLQAVDVETFTAFYADRPSCGFACDGVPIGGILFDGSQAHIAVLPQHHGRWAFLFEPALDWLFSCQPEMTVEIERDNLPALRFLQRYGWHPAPTPDGTDTTDTTTDTSVVRFHIAQATRRQLSKR